MIMDENKMIEFLQEKLKIDIKIERIAFSYDMDVTVTLKIEDTVISKSTDYITGVTAPWSDVE